MISFREPSEKEKARFRVAVQGERLDTQSKLMDAGEWLDGDYVHGHPEDADITDDEEEQEEGEEEAPEEQKETMNPEGSDEGGGDVNQEGDEGYQKKNNA